jgi:hypothetical protein
MPKQSPEELNTRYKWHMDKNITLSTVHKRYLELESQYITTSKVTKQADFILIYKTLIRKVWERVIIEAYELKLPYGLGLFYIKEKEGYDRVYYPRGRKNRKTGKWEIVKWVENLATSGRLFRIHWYRDAYDYANATRYRFFPAKGTYDESTRTGTGKEFLKGWIKYASTTPDEKDYRANIF